MVQIMAKNDVYLCLRVQDVRFLESCLTEYYKLLNSNYRIAEKLPVGALSCKNDFLVHVGLERSFILSFIKFLDKSSSYTPTLCVSGKKCRFPHSTCYECVYSHPVFNLFQFDIL